MIHVLHVPLQYVGVPEELLPSEIWSALVSEYSLINLLLTPRITTTTPFIDVTLFPIPLKWNTPPPPLHPHCSGTSEGPILMLNIPAQGSAVTFTRQLKGHTASISDLATNSHGQLASSDESGCIMVWPDPLSSSESSVVVADARSVPYFPFFQLVVSSWE